MYNIVHQLIYFKELAYFWGWMQRFCNLSPDQSLQQFGYQWSEKVEGYLQYYWWSREGLKMACESKEENHGLASWLSEHNLVSNQPQLGQLE